MGWWSAGFVAHLAAREKAVVLGGLVRAYSFRRIKRTLLTWAHAVFQDWFWNVHLAAAFRRIKFSTEKRPRGRSRSLISLFRTVFEDTGVESLFLFRISMREGHLFFLVEASSGKDGFLCLVPRDFLVLILVVHHHRFMFTFVFPQQE